MAFKIGDKVVLYRSCFLTNAKVGDKGAIIECWKGTWKGKLVKKYEVDFEDFGCAQTIYLPYLKHFKS